MIDRIISSTFLLAMVFSVVAMTAATVMTYAGHMDAQQWLTALSTCSYLVLGVIGKRAVDGVTKAFEAKNAQSNP